MSFAQCCRKLYERQGFLVDDEVNVLQGYRRQLRKQFDVTIAEGGKEAIGVLGNEGPFNVVVSDMQMPEMNGLQFLQEASRISPNSVRIMLTGNADQKTAIDAVNEGKVFRFLNKPCTPEVLTDVIQAGCEQYRSQQVERELLSKTLSASVNLMTEVLSLTNPSAFGLNTQIRKLTAKICQHLKLANSWEIELAAMLSQTGCITIPEDILRKRSMCEPLSPEEQELFDRHPEVGYGFINKIPKLNNVALMIKHQLASFEVDAGKENEPIPFGARILRLANDAVTLQAKLVHSDLVLEAIQDRANEYDPTLVAALGELLKDDCRFERMMVSDITVGMILEEDVFTNAGQFLLPAGHELTFSTLHRLRSFAKNPIGLREPIRVLLYEPPTRNGKMA